MNPWKTLSSKVVYENRFGKKIREYDVIRPDGNPGMYAVYEVPAGIGIIALTDDKEIYLIRQFRFPINRFSWEIPAGFMDEDDPLGAAKRELKEETGLIADKWTMIGEIYLYTGSSNEKSTIFLAKGLTDTGEHDQAEEGIEEVKTVKISEALDMIKKGEIIDAGVVAGLLMAADHLGIGVNE